MGWDAGSIESRLDVDLSPFHHGLQKAKDEAREFADKRYTATVDINTKRSQDELSAVETRLHSIESSLDRIGTKTGGAGGGGRVFGGGSSGGRGGFLSRLPNPSWMSLGIGAAIPAAIPFAGLAGGIAGGALSAGVTGGLGLGAFGLAAKSNVKTITGDITKLNKLTGQYNAATTDKQRAAVLVKEQALWKSLDPQQRAAVKNVQALDAAWGRYKKKLEPQTFAVVADGAKIANTGLKYLLPTAQAVGDEVDLLARRAEKAFKAPFWHQFFGDFLPGEAARSVGTLGTVLGNVGSGIGHLVEDFAPLAHILEGGSESLSARFEKWTEGSGPGKFVAWVEKEGPPAGKALEGIAKGVKGLAEGFAPLGSLELKALTPILNFIGDLGDEHPAVITAIGGSLLALGGGLKAIQGVNSLKTIFGDGSQTTGLRRSILGLSGAIGAFSIGAATSGTSGAAGVGEATLGGALSGLAAGLAAGGPFGAALGAAGGAVLGLTGRMLAAEGATHRADKATQDWMKTAYQADNFKIGQQFNAGIVSSLQKSPTTSSIFATAGVKVGQIASSIETQNAIGGPAGLQLQAAERAGKISQQQYQQGVTALQSLVSNFGSVVTDLDNIAIITGRTSQHLGLLAADAKKLADVVFAQPGPKIPGLPHLPPAPRKPPTFTDILSGAIPKVPSNARKALGGPVVAGRLYQVNEQGVELFQPAVNGTIVPHNQARAMAMHPPPGPTRLSVHDMQQLARLIADALAARLPGVNQGALDRSLGIAVMSA